MGPEPPSVVLKSELPDLDHDDHFDHDDHLNHADHLVPDDYHKVNRCLARYSPRATTINRPTNRAPKKPAWPGPN